MNKVKFIIFFFLLFNITHAQEFDLSKKFSWEQFEKNNPTIIQEFMVKNINFYLDGIYSPIEFMKKLHVVDVNNDGLDDVIFEGMNGGEPQEIYIFLNQGNSFKNVFHGQQTFNEMIFENGILKEIRLSDWDCCAGYLKRNKWIDVSHKNGELTFNEYRVFEYTDNTVLPSEYWSNPKKIKTLNDNYNMRYAPEINDTTENYITFELHLGNSVAKIPKNTEALAIAESTDSTGRIWYFVAIPPKYELRETVFYDDEEKADNYRCGWISSNFIEVIE